MLAEINIEVVTPESVKESEESTQISPIKILQ
jgi:hypothetical protein